jgi:uncharacterized phage protein (TIGR02216 family)
MSAAGESFPWQRLMHIGLGVLCLSPKEFWAATPREIAAAFGGPTPPLQRNSFEDLMKRYPRLMQTPRKQ